MEPAATAATDDGQAAPPRYTSRPAWGGAPGGSGSAPLQVGEQFLEGGDWHGAAFGGAQQRAETPHELGAVAGRRSPGDPARVQASAGRANGRGLVVVGVVGVEEPALTGCRGRGAVEVGGTTARGSGRPPHEAAIPRGSRRARTGDAATEGNVDDRAKHDVATEGIVAEESA